MSALDHILNWRRINARLTSSGQPSADQLADIRDTGVSHIVNLGLGTGEGALEDEAEHVASLRMTYIHIPVDFENPTDQDFEDFRRAIESAPQAQIHVHCIYNARVSAFFYRYASGGGELTEQEAFAILESIWRPGQDWSGFLGNPALEGMPNRYAGKDY